MVVGTRVAALCIRERANLYLLPLYLMARRQVSSPKPFSLPIGQIKRILKSCCSYFLLQFAMWPLDGREGLHIGGGHLLPAPGFLPLRSRWKLPKSTNNEPPCWDATLGLRRPLLVPALLPPLLSSSLYWGPGKPWHSASPEVEYENSLHLVLPNGFSLISPQCRDVNAGGIGPELHKP